MSDEQRRREERKALLDPSHRRRDRTRAQTRMGHYRRLIGQRVYYQGLRMNYVGTLCDVLADAYGEPTELLFTALTYVGEWGVNGPVAQYCMDMPCDPVPQALTIGAEQVGLAPEGW